MRTPPSSKLSRPLSTHYEPEGPVAEYLVEHLAACIWRLRRVPAIEAGIYSCFRLWIEGEEVRERRNHKEDDIPYGQEDAYRTANKEKERIDEQLHEYQPAIGRAFLRAQCSIESLIRIASAIEGSMYRASRELERMKAGRHYPVNEDFVIDAEVDEEDWPE